MTAAARLLAAGRPPLLRDDTARRFLDLLATGEFDPAGLFVARGAGGAVRGAVLAQLLPGALGILFPPRTVPGGRDVDALFAAAFSWLRGRGVKVCQSFAPGGDRSDELLLARGGFRHVTAVVHLRRELDAARARQAIDPAACPLAFDPYTPDDFPAFAAALLASHDGSLDCPELTGTRTPAELVEGYCGQADVLNNRWFLARDAGEPVGVVMLDVGAEPESVELSYLGLVPAARGRRWGHWLVRFAARMAAAEDARLLTLSADARNEPARRLYARHGFTEVDRREVYLWDDGEAPAVEGAG
ncbi:MAG TPA: GNAT family N-acetyltransferase [Urbifossiella sp.]|nr:GNAT family N-acetyltransferase [Urbifossiella sp.]